ncbi:MAG: hypothetical protein RLZZ01_963 [Actinomycetota bacterium]
MAVLWPITPVQEVSSQVLVLVVSFDAKSTRGRNPTSEHSAGDTLRRRIRPNSSADEVIVARPGSRTVAGWEWTTSAEHPTSPRLWPDTVVTGLARLAHVGDESHSTPDLDAEFTEARRRLIEAPAEVVVANHAMGLWELAAIHLAADRPDLDAAALAIDAVGALVDGLGDRLGEHADTMRTALSNIREVFEQIDTRS